MTLPSPDLDNLLPWVIQISAVSLLGTLLPMLFGVRHPRTQLAFGYTVLAICLLLPVIQPKRITARPVQRTAIARVEAPAAPMPVQAPRAQTPVVVSGPSEADAVIEQTDTSTDAATTPVWRGWRLTWMLFWMFVAGAVYRLVRLAIGAWQIRRYRVAATPLYPVPDAIAQAMQLTRARAVVCLSTDVASPATLGLFRPVILLPQSFLSLREPAQQAVVCHELLHVRRRDWALAMLEGVVSALLWFSPVAWLISEIRLAREQLVDAEVVRLTSAKEPYIRALLDIARGRPSLDLVPAPLFIRRRHLTARVQLLLDGAADSFRRLSVCYATMSALLVAVGWMAVALFPLAAMPQVASAAVARVNPSRETSPPGTPVPGPTASAPAAPAATATAADSAPEADAWAEPIVGAIATASTPSERAATLALLEHARQNSDLHIDGTPPFHLEAAFEAWGQVTDVGSGELSETWMSGQRWRWTATLGSYSQIRIGSGQTGLDVEPVSTVPIRVHMLRRAIFLPVRVVSGSRVRVAAARVNGAAVTCVLLGPSNVPASAARLWQEDEYCVDGAGLLRVHSPALGAYTRFDYAQPLRFGGRVLPNEIHAYLGGVEVLRARLTIRSAGDADGALFTPTPEMVARGLRRSSGVGQKVLLNAPAADDTEGPEIVVVHAAVDPSGAVLEAEVASGDSRLAPAALDIVRRRRFVEALTQRDFYVGVNFGRDPARP